MKILGWRYLKDFVKLVKKNKKVSIVIGIILIVIILFFLLKGWMFPDISKSLYGNRLEGIEDVPIEEKQVTELKNKIKDNSFVKNVDYRLQGRLVNVEVEVSKDADKEKVKELANVLTETFTNEQKKYYDLQIFISSSDYSSNVIGYKHKSSESFAWTSN